jgi:hypothetical protein
MLKRFCAALALGVCAMAAFAPGAAADPINAKEGLVLPLTCDGQSVEVAVNGNGDFTPGHVVGSTAVFVLEAFDLTFQFTPTGGPTETETASRSKHNVHGDVATCTVDFSQTTPEGTFRILGSAMGFFTPAS